MSRRTPQAGWILSVFPFAGLGWIVAQALNSGISGNGRFLVDRLEWIPALGIDLSFRLDGLSLVFAILVLGVGGLIVIYAGGYLHGAAKLHRFYGFLLLFMGSMLGLVLSENLLAMFIFWEMTSVSSYLMIGYYHEDGVSRKKALQALLVTGAGGLCLLAGVVLLGQVVGSYEFGAILSAREEVLESSFYLPIVVLVFLGAFTKSAQVPFHFWLPNAMAAPTPVSAYLHSATMVKAGVFLLARLTPVLGGTASWQVPLMVVGAITMLLAALRGIGQTDLKRVLAFTTLSVLGILTMLIGVGTELALKAAVIFLIGHALYKAALFMTVGSVDHGTGTRDVRLLGGLRRAMPLTFAAAILAALSKAGFPPFFGFLGKEYVYKSGLAAGGFETVLVGMAVLTNMLLLAMALKAGLHPFVGRLRADELPHSHPHEGGVSMWMPPLFLAVTGLAMGLLPGLLEKPLVEPAVAALLAGPVDLKIALWHGFSLPLLLSILTVGGGLLIYFNRARFWNTREADGAQGAEWVYERVLAAVISFSRGQTRFFQNGYLANYLRVILGTIGVLLLIALFRWEGAMPEGGGIHPLGLTVVLGMAIAAVTAVLSNSRLGALIALGVVGLGVAFLFVLYSAPDLAITQVFVETLTVVLMMMVIYRLPRLKALSTRGKRVGDAFFAGVIGLAVAWLVLKAQQVQVATPVSGQLGEWSYLEAKGRNVVNVILVDFRALDTFGEILVLVIAALGVAALMRGRSTQTGNVRESGTTGPQRGKEEL